MLTTIVAVATATIGCGGSETRTSASDSGGGGSTPASKAGFVKRASAICARDREGTLERVGAYQERHSSEGLSEAALRKESIISALSSTIQKEIADLNEVPLPRGEEKQVEAILSATRAALDNAKESKVKSPKKFDGYFVDVNQKLREYGLKECRK